MEPTPDTDQLTARNQERMQALMSGALGVKVQPIPGTFEWTRCFAYLEHIAANLGCRDDAEQAAQERISLILDGMESQAGQIMLTHGVAEGMGQVHDLRNRQERRHP